MGDVSQKDTRNAASDLFKVKAAYEEVVLQLEEVRRENKALSNEVKDIMDQINEGGRSIHEIEEAEEIAALNLAKYRKVAGALGDAEAVADANEQALALK